MTHSNQTPKRVAMYCRVASSKASDISKSIWVQKTLLYKYAILHQMDDVVDEYTDAGISGNTLERPGLNNLRAAIKKGEVDIVLATHPDRLTRNVALRSQLMQEFESKGVEVLFHNTEHQDSTELLITLVQIVAEAIEQQTLSDRIKRHMRCSDTNRKKRGGR